MSLESQIECFSENAHGLQVIPSPEEFLYIKCVDAAEDAFTSSILSDSRDLRLLIVPEIAEKMEIVHNATNGRINSANLMKDGVNGLRMIVRHKELEPIAISDTDLKPSDFDQKANQFKQCMNTVFERAFAYMQSGGLTHAERQRLASIKRGVREIPSGRSRNIHSRPASSDDNSR